MKLVNSLSVSLLVLLLPYVLLANPIPTFTSDTIEDSLLTERGAPLNAFLSLLLKNMPTLNKSITSLTGVLTVFENFLVLITGEKIMYNDLTTGGGCKPYTLLFARGTMEPGNIGILVGPPLVLAISTAIGASNLAVQGVNSYAASVNGYLAGGDVAGSQAMAQQIKSVYQSCPSTKLVIGGYSQGAQLVHNSLKLVSNATAGWVGKVVMFGDPYNREPIRGVSPEKILTFCHVDDDICRFGDLVLPTHLSYGVDAAKAVAFAVS